MSLNIQFGKGQPASSSRIQPYKSGGAQESPPRHKEIAVPSSEALDPVEDKRAESAHASQYSADSEEGFINGTKDMRVCACFCACKNVEHADYTAEESFMGGVKDMRPDDLMDEEQAITLLRRHGFSDRRIEAILRRLDGADCESCGKRD